LEPNLLPLRVPADLLVALPNQIRMVVDFTEVSEDDCLQRVVIECLEE
jgi:hypothetical protein